MVAPEYFAGAHTGEYMSKVGDHYRPTGGAGERGVYRVVGTGDPLALLLVTDGNGSRIHSGELRHVSPATLDSEFETAADPDAGFHPVRSIENQMAGIYWQFRRFL